MIASYLRVSSDEQRERGTIEIQRDEIKRYREYHKLAEIVEFADDGVTGKIPFKYRNRGRDLLEAIKAGKVDKVIVYKWDRLARRLHIGYAFVRLLQKRNVDLICIDEKFDTSTPAGRMAIQMFLMIAEMELENIRQRTSAGTKRRLENVPDGFMGGVHPYGYRVEGIKKDSRLVPDEELIPDLKISPAQAVRRIYKMAAQGKSCAVIAAWLIDQKIPTTFGLAELRGDPINRKQRSSMFWRGPRVRNIIVNTAYKGIIYYGKRLSEVEEDEDGEEMFTRRKANKDKSNWLERQCPALVDESLWNRAQAALKHNQTALKAHVKNDYLLRGLIRCGICGRTYCGQVINRSNGNTEFYYRCNGQMSGKNFANGSACKNSAIRGDEIEPVFWAQIKDWAYNPGKIRHELEKNMPTERGVAEQLAALENTLASRESGHAVLRRQLTKGFVTEKQFEAEVVELNRDIANFKGEIKKLKEGEVEAETHHAVMGRALTRLDQLRRMLDNGHEPSFAFRRQTVEEVLISAIAHEPKPVNGKVRRDMETTWVFDDQHKCWKDQWIHDEEGGIVVQRERTPLACRVLHDCGRRFHSL